MQFCPKETKNFNGYSIHLASADLNDHFAFVNSDQLWKGKEKINDFYYRCYILEI